MAKIKNRLELNKILKIIHQKVALETRMRLFDITNIKIYMPKKAISFIIFSFIFFYAIGQTKTSNLICYEQKHNKIKYSFKNQKGGTVLGLDSSVFERCFTDTLQYFAIVKYKNKKGFSAIDKNKKVLFSVFDNSGQGTYPDIVNEGMIRIVNDIGKIGFANFKGEIIIPPTFDYAEKFYKNSSIVGNECKNKIVGEYETVEGKFGSMYEFTCVKAGYIDNFGKRYLWGEYSVHDLKIKLRSE